MHIVFLVFVRDRAKVHGLQCSFKPARLQKIGVVKHNMVHHRLHEPNFGRAEKLAKINTTSCTAVIAQTISINGPSKSKVLKHRQLQLKSVSEQDSCFVFPRG